MGTAARITCFGPTNQVKNTNFDGFANLQAKANWHEISNNGKRIIYKETDEWQRVVQRVTTNDNDWYNEWQRVVQRMIASDKEWQQVTISDNFSFFQIREEPTTKHPKGNCLNIEEDLLRRPIELTAETSF